MFFPGPNSLFLVLSISRHDIVSCPVFILEGLCSDDNLTFDVVEDLLDTRDTPRRSLVYKVCTSRFSKWYDKGKIEMEFVVGGIKG